AATPPPLILYPYLFLTEGSVAQQLVIVESFSPDFHQVVLRPFEAMVFLLLAGFALRRPTLYEFVLVAAAMFLALQSVRNVALFVAAATPVLITTSSAWWNDFSAARKRQSTLPPRPAFAVIPAAV